MVQSNGEKKEWILVHTLSVSDDRVSLATNVRSSDRSEMDSGRDHSSTDV